MHYFGEKKGRGNFSKIQIFPKLDFRPVKHEHFLMGSMLKINTSGKEFILGISRFYQYESCVV